MNAVRYNVSSGAGPEAARIGSVADLVGEIPYLLVWGVLPPRRVLNAVLRSGESDAGLGGGCRWRPFEVCAEEYGELADTLGLPAGGDAPGWVRTGQDWMIWMTEARLGVPAEEHRRLSAEYERAERAFREARVRAGEEAPIEGELLELYVDSMEAGQRLSEFVNWHAEREVHE